MSLLEPISFHVKTGVKITYTFENDNGTPRDMTGVTVEFSVSNGFTKNLIQDPSNTQNMILTLLGSELTGLVGKKASYIVVDKGTTPAGEVATGPLVITGWL